AAENLLLVGQHVVLPAVRIAHCLVERAVQRVQAGREVPGGGHHAPAVLAAEDLQRVVEVGQRALLERRLRHARRVEPRVALLVEPPGSVADGAVGGVIGWLLARRPGEGEGFEAGGWVIGGIIPYAVPGGLPNGPNLMRSGMQYSKEIIIFPTDD